MSFDDAVPKDKKRAKLTDYTHTRVATKFPNVAKQFFHKVKVCRWNI